MDQASNTKTYISTDRIADLILGGGGIIRPDGIQIQGDLEGGKIHARYQNDQGKTVTHRSRELSKAGLGFALMDAEEIKDKGLAGQAKAGVHPAGFEPTQTGGEIAELRTWLKEKSKGQWGTDLSSSVMNVILDAFEAERAGNQGQSQ